MRRPGRAIHLLPALLLLAACGGTPPDALEPTPPPVPLDLCASLPAALTKGLQPSTSSDLEGTPTAACALTSPDGANPAVRAVVTVTQYGEQSVASGVFATQCRAIDPAQYTVSQGFTAQGAEKACAGKGSNADESTLAAVHLSDVLTVRVSSIPAGDPDALTRGKQLLEAAIAALPGASPGASPSASPSS